MTPSAGLCFCEPGGRGAPRTELAQRARRGALQRSLVSAVEKAERATHGPRLDRGTDRFCVTRIHPSPAAELLHCRASGGDTAIQSRCALGPGLGGPLQSGAAERWPAAPWAPDFGAGPVALRAGQALCSWAAEPSVTVRGSRQMTSDGEVPSNSVLVTVKCALASLLVRARPLALVCPGHVLVAV